MNFKNLIQYLSKEDNLIFFEMLRKSAPKEINEISTLIKENPQKPIKEILSLLRIQNSVKNRIIDSSRYIFSEKSAQQGSSSIMARYHSNRLKHYKKVADLCCGSGMDLIEIAKNKDKIWAVDLDEETLAMAEFNSKQAGLDNITFLNCKAEDFDKSVEAVFIDPDRRSGSKRLIRVEDYSPNLEAILKFYNRIPAILCKFSPALDYKSIALNVPHSWEFVSEKGELKEALLSLGKIASDLYETAAIMADTDEIITSAQPEIETITEIKSYLYEPDPAVIRAGLVTQLAYQLNLTRFDSNLALLTSDTDRSSNWTKLYQVYDIQKFNLKKIKKYLRDNDIGILTIKTRGFPESVESFRRKIKLKGKNAALMFILRYKNYHITVFAKEVK